MSFEAAKQVADAILYEGYVLYPYRASAAKNQVRWQFGVLAPKDWAEGGGEHAEQQTQCLLEAEDDAVVELRLRFLQVQAKLIEELGAAGTFAEVPSLTVDGSTLITWDEAVEQQVELQIPVAQLLAGDEVVAIGIPGGEEVQEVRDAGGSVAGRVRRCRRPLEATLRVAAERLDGPFGAIRLTVRIDNETPYGDAGAPRRDAMRSSLVACHTLLGLMPTGSGRFISLLEPPQWAKADAESCVNLHTFPVLIGANRDRPEVVLSSPIILYDWPEIAPESQGDLFDATEIDEILILRTMTLTDEEKREARATDPRAAEIIDRVDSMPQELLDRLHGAVRYLRDVTGSPAEVPEIATGSDGMPVFGQQPPGTESTPWWDPGADSSVDPDTDTVEIGGVLVAKGARVRLRPGARRSDAQDMFLAGKVAEVQAVFHDLEGKRFLAVTLEDDPNADLQIQHGRFLYFSPDEVEPIGAPTRRA
ncbi:MAG TPA: hypothetical protein VKL22_09915 [Actinomycetota bacterium]|nr:hypothetical protein [Actinomycetota bacterium]